MQICERYNLRHQFAAPTEMEILSRRNNKEITVVKMLYQLHDYHNSIMSSERATCMKIAAVIKLNITCVITTAVALGQAVMYLIIASVAGALFAIKNGNCNELKEAAMLVLYAWTNVFAPFVACYQFITSTSTTKPLIFFENEYQALPSVQRRAL